MLPTKPRPVPTKAALKVLYQLAYITSGTAVGVATLCVEERRRKLQLVQRVADNAKRLRQSPRYYQNVALAENHPEVERILRVSERDDVKGPELPSVVEEHYGRRETRDWTRTRKRKTTVRDGLEADNVLQRDASPHTSRRPSNTPLAQLTEEMAKTDRTRPYRHSVNDISTVANMKERWTLEKQALSQLPAVRQQRYPSNSSDVRSNNSASDRASSAEPNAVHNRSRSSMHRRAQKGSDGQTREPHSLASVHEAIDKFLARTHQPPFVDGGPLGDDPPEANSATDAAHHIDLLLEYGPFTTSNPHQPDISGESHQTLNDTAHDLLRTVVRLGSWSDILRLSRWMDQRTSLDSKDIRHILHSIVAASTRACLSRDEVLSQCQAIFALGAFQTTAMKFKLNCALDILLGHFANSATKTTQDHDRFEKVQLSNNQSFAESILMSSIARESIRHGRLPDFVRTFMDSTILKYARALVEQRYCSEAWELISAANIKLDFGMTGSGLAVLLDRTFQSALASVDLATCAVVLRMEKWDTTAGRFARHRDLFLRTCDQFKVYDVVGKLFIDSDTKIDPGLGNLDGDDDRLAILAMAAAECSDYSNSEASFTGTYRHLSQRLRLRVAERYPSSLALSQWQTLRDYQTSNEQLDMIANDLKNIDPMAARRVLLAQLDVQIRSNDHETARKTLAMLHESQPADHDTVGRAALMLAKTNNWEHLTDLFALASRSGFLSLGSKSITKFNAVISVFSQCHTAGETWQFVTDWMYTYRFIPNVATTEILLGAFVSQKSIHLIPRWLRNLRTMGLRFEVDARVAVKLLTRYYRENRPSHFLMLCLCRNLASFAPALAGNEYASLVEEAIGFDLRNFSGLRHATENTIQAQSLLHLLPSTFQKTGRPRFGQHDTNVRTDVPVCPPSHGKQDALAMLPDSTRDDGEEQVVSESAHKTDRQYGPDDQFVSGDTSKIQPLVTETSLDRMAAPNTEEVGMKSFGRLRPMYESVGCDWIGSELKDSLDEEIHSRPVKKMILALSLKDNAKVLSIYHKSLDVAGLPLSPLALEVAVEASLRSSHGDPSEAESIMKRAHEAGMNTACAMGPLLIHQIKKLDHKEKRNFRQLRLTVLEYYRLNKKHHLPVKHEVGKTAAHELLRCNRPRDALELLEGIYRSDWAEEKDADLAAMTIFLRAYAALGFMHGVRWVLDTVLKREMRIDLKFLKTLREVAEQVDTRVNVRRPRTRTSAGALPNSVEEGFSLPTAITLCYKRRAQQVAATKALGRQLAATLAHCANEMSSERIDIDAWPSIWEATSRPPSAPIAMLEDTTPQDVQASRNHTGGPVGSNTPILAEQLAQRPATNYRPIAQDHAGAHIGSNTPVLPGPGATMKSRAFVQGQRRLDDRVIDRLLRQDIVTPDGKTLSFRKCLVTWSEGKALEPHGSPDTTARKKPGWKIRPFSATRRRRRRLGLVAR